MKKSKVKAEIDQAIIEAYAEYGFPVDELLSTSVLWMDMYQKVLGRLPIGWPGLPGEDLVRKSLLRLRKCGRLPNLRRKYLGRKSKEPAVQPETNKWLPYVDQPIPLEMAIGQAVLSIVDSLVERHERSKSAVFCDK